MSGIARKLMGVTKGVAVDPDLVLVFDTSLGDLTVEVPLAGTVNCTVDWGDGSSDAYTTTGTKTHTYASSGEYEVRVSGTLTGFGGPVLRPELIRCLSFGNIGLTNIAGAFWRCANFIECPNILPVGVTTLRDTFRAASSFNQDLNGWNTSNVTDLGSLFRDATSFNGIIGGWDTSNVQNMSRVFQGASSFNKPISGWNTASATNMSIMFYEASVFNQNVSSWNTSSVTSMDFMFGFAANFNQDLSPWITGLTSQPNSFSGGATAWIDPTWRPYLADGVTQINT